MKRIVMVFAVMVIVLFSGSIVVHAEHLGDSRICQQDASGETICLPWQYNYDEDVMLLAGQHFEFRSGYSVLTAQDWQAVKKLRTYVWLLEEGGLEVSINGLVVSPKRISSSAKRKSTGEIVSDFYSSYEKEAIDFPDTEKKGVTSFDIVFVIKNTTKKKVNFHINSIGAFTP